MRVQNCNKPVINDPFLTVLSPFLLIGPSHLLTINAFPVRVTHLVDSGHFWTFLVKSVGATRVLLTEITEIPGFTTLGHGNTRF